jgi:ABC-2 type transport system permease protein
MIFVWASVFTTSGVTTIGGFTLPTMYLYFFIVNGVGATSINDGNISNELQSDIQNGNITNSLIRPISYTVQLFLYSVPVELIAFASLTLPFLIIIFIIGHITATPLFLLLFAVEIAVSYVVTTLIDFIIGTFSIHLTNIWGILSVSGMIYSLLGGGFIPLNLFPSWTTGILSLLPCQLSLYIPAATLLGMVSVNSIVQSIIVGIVWAIALFIFAALWWKRVNRKMTSAGG